MRIYSFWCRAPSQGNVGDAIGPWLIHQITGTYPTFLRPEAPVPKFLVAGSIIGYAQRLCSVWGSGIMNRDDPVSAEAEFHSVRGPLTRELAVLSGARCPKVYGDPALLLPRFYSPDSPPRSGIGLIPHFADKARLATQLDPSLPIRVIDVQQPVTSFVDQLRTCELIGSSSLHGIIVSHAYGIPAAWVSFHPLPSGDDTKFHDYYLSIGQPTQAPLPLSSRRPDLRAVSAAATLPEIQVDLDALLDCCPFR